MNFSYAAGHLDLDNRGARATDYVPFGCELSIKVAAGSSAVRLGYAACASICLEYFPLRAALLHLAR